MVDVDGVGVVAGEDVVEGIAVVCASTTVLIKRTPRTKIRGNKEAPFILNEISQIPRGRRILLKVINRGWLNSTHFSLKDIQILASEKISNLNWIERLIAVTVTDLAYNAKRFYTM